MPRYAPMPLRPHHRHALPYSGLRFTAPRSLHPRVHSCLMPTACTPRWSSKPDVEILGIRYCNTSVITAVMLCVIIINMPNSAQFLAAVAPLLHTQPGTLADVLPSCVLTRRVAGTFMHIHHAPCVRLRRRRPSEARHQYIIYCNISVIITNMQ